MSNIITGSIAVLMSVVFFGYYAVKLESVAVWIIIVGCLAMLVRDFVESIRKVPNGNTD